MEDSSTGLVIIKLLSVFLVVLANAFFVASEFALVSVRRSGIEALAQQGNRSAQSVLRLLESPTIFISSSQLGVTLASLGLGWLGETTLADDIFIPLFTRLLSGKAAVYVSAHAVSVLLAFASITVFHIVLGEITPKTMALEKTQKMALLVARPLELFYRVFKPVISLLNFLSLHALKMLGLNASLAHNVTYSEEELRYIVSASYQSGVLDEHERSIIHNVFDFTDKIVREVMVPRPEVAALDISLSFPEVVDRFNSTGYSRMPVYSDQLDNIKGVVHGKDLMSYFSHQESFSMAAIARKPLYIPDGASLQDALKQMQSSKMHFGIVVDEYGGVEGIVTLEDLLEEIVGEIDDEHDAPTEEPLIHMEENGVAIATGWVPVREANRTLNLGIPESDDYTTLAGFLLSRSGKVLSEGDRVEFGRFVFIVEQTARHRVIRVRIEESERAVETSAGE